MEENQSPIHSSHLKKWFQLSQDAGQEPNISDSLLEIGQDPNRVLKLANSEYINRIYAEKTDLAESKGIFGSPSFIINGELFWGDDRLEHAFSWSKKQQNIFSKIRIFCLK